VLFDGISAFDLRTRLLARELSPADVAGAFLDSVGADDLHVWASIDPDGLLGQAAALSALGTEQRTRLPLFGVPVGIKDNFDTADLPTGYGSPIYAGNRPGADAAAVVRLRAAGALIAGKTKCAEFAWMTPSDTLNPLDRSRTPGGSSNGSAAAVAAGAVPLATGSQTAGSIIRPGSYCAVLGFKPSFGRYDRGGVKLMSETLDTVGLLARSLGDLLLVDAVLAADPGQPEAPLGSRAIGPRAPAPLTSEPGPLRIAYAPTPLADQIEPDARSAIDSWLADARSAGAISAATIEVPGYARLAEAQTTIQLFESARSLAPELRSAPDRLSAALREALLAGMALPVAEYARARTDAETFGPAALEALASYDAVLTPSTTGAPPAGIAFTGDPMFCRVWTLIGAPCVSLPLAWTAAGLPAGLQLVAAPGRDRALLETAATLQERLVRP
jgi:amidase